MTDAARRVPGSGLAGLRERLAAVGGRLDATATGERFVLRATVPVAVGATAGVGE